MHTDNEQPNNGSVQKLHNDKFLFQGTQTNTYLCLITGGEHGLLMSWNFKDGGHVKFYT